MILSAIWNKQARENFSKDLQNCTSPSANCGL